MSLSKHRRDLATDSEFSIVDLPEKRPRTSVLALMPPPSDPHPSETSLDDQEDPEDPEEDVKEVLGAHRMWFWEPTRGKGDVLAVRVGQEETNHHWQTLKDPEVRSGMPPTHLASLTLHVQKWKLNKGPDDQGTWMLFMSWTGTDRKGKPWPNSWILDKDGHRPWGKVKAWEGAGCQQRLPFEVTEGTSSGGLSERRLLLPPRKSSPWEKEDIGLIKAAIARVADSYGEVVLKDMMGLTKLRMRSALEQSVHPVNYVRPSQNKTKLTKTGLFAVSAAELAGFPQPLPEGVRNGQACWQWTWTTQSHAEEFIGATARDFYRLHRMAGLERLIKTAIEINEDMPMR
jgi:hypothetical protein